MVLRLKPITQHDYLVTISGYESYWTKFSGVEITTEETKFNDGIAKVNRTILATMQHENVTLEKPYDPINDATLIEQIQALRFQQQDLTITIEPVYRGVDGPERIGDKSWTLQGCQIIRFKMSEADTEASDTSMMELELSVDEAVFN